MLHQLAEEAKALFGGAVSKLSDIAHEMSSLDFVSHGLKGLFSKIDGVTGQKSVLLSASPSRRYHYVFTFLFVC